MSRTLVALHAHPDDESSKGASTVAKLVDEGVRAVLVTATGGEAGDILNPVMDTPDTRKNLSAVRAKELETAAGIIGYHHIDMLGYRDSGMADSDDNRRPDAFCNQPFDEVLERIVTVIRRERPDVVFGYDAHDFYPHPDHLRIHDISLQIVDASQDPDRFPAAGEPWRIPNVYAPIFAGERLVALHEAMLTETGESPFTDWLNRLSGYHEPERWTAKYNVSGYVERGRNALRAHRTQVEPDGFWFSVPTEIVEAVYPWEDFEVLSSQTPWESEETDLFAGLVQ